MCVTFFCIRTDETLLAAININELRAETHVGVHVSVRYICPALTKIVLRPQHLFKQSSIRFHRNRFSDSLIASCI
jgi:hypothetical protein